MPSKLKSNKLLHKPLWINLSLNKKNTTFYAIHTSIQHTPFSCLMEIISEMPGSLLKSTLKSNSTMNSTEMMTPMTITNTHSTITIDKFIQTYKLLILILHALLWIITMPSTLIITLYTVTCRWIRNIHIILLFY